MEKESIKVLKTVTGDEIIGFITEKMGPIGVLEYVITNPLGIVGGQQPFIPYLISAAFPGTSVSIKPQQVVVEPFVPSESYVNAYYGLFETTPGIIVPDKKLIV